MILGLKESELENKKAVNTFKEIYQQPKTWKELKNIIESNKENINNLWKTIKNNNANIIFTGSGTSGYIGDSLAPFLKFNKISANSYHGTDLNSNPAIYFDKNQPTLLVSFARSGDSPESIGAVQLLKEIVKKNWQLNITCNPKGKLYLESSNSKDSFAILMPEGTNDKSFAMTSSYSNMLLAALHFFNYLKLSLDNDFNNLIKNCEYNLDNNFEIIKKISANNYERVIYLGSNTLYGFSEEASLKILELTAGKVVSVSNTCMGFRHGPKSIINNKTLVVVMLSSNPYTRQYDLDILKEIYKDHKCQTVVALDNTNDSEVSKYCDVYYYTSKNYIENDVVLGLQYVLFGQIFAVFKSLELKQTPDNPCPTGEVNRVVKGVTIYPFKN